MEINRNGLNSLPQQVEENMKNIVKLASYLKEAYNSNIDLGDSAVSIAINDTNANNDTIEGWLISQDGYLYKITGGDGTNLLLEYFTRLKGDTGATGTPGDPTLLIDDNDVLNNKTWSSDKISQIISYVKDKGIYATKNTPSLDGGNLYYEDSDILNSSSPNPPRYSDLIIYIDGDDKAKYLYQITGVSGDETKYYVSQIAEFGGGKKQYQHNIYIKTESGTYGYSLCMITIINDSDIAFIYDTLATYLNTKGYTSTSKLNTLAHGRFYDTLNSDYNILGVYSSDGNNINSVCTRDANSTITGAIYKLGVSTFRDECIEI